MKQRMANLFKSKTKVLRNHVVVKDEKQDQGWAWVICFSCAFLNAVIYGIFRSYGVIFVEILNHFQVSRETASWPFSLCMTITHLTGNFNCFFVKLILFF